MRVLFLHHNFPAQYKNLTQALAADPKNEVVFGTNRQEGALPNVKKAYYTPAREPNLKIHPYLHPAEYAILNGQAVYRMAQKLRQEGFIPDIVCAHSGWGQAHFIKDVFPQARLLCLFEWYYKIHDSDFGFWPGTKVTPDRICFQRMRNTPILFDLITCDWGLNPTKWQQSQFPKLFQPKMSILHEGVDTKQVCPTPNKVGLKLPTVSLSPDDEIVTYVSRGLEPYRGFPEFMKAAQIIQQRRPKCHIVIAGEDRVCYGKKLPEGQSFKQKILSSGKFDMSRLHFTGPLLYSDLVKLYQASTVHVYLTAPFVLSWSLLEAMSAGCVVVGSATPPVQEIIENNRNGFLVEFFSPSHIAERTIEVLENPGDFGKIRQRARQTILKRYALEKLLPKQIAMMQKLVAKKN